MTTAKTPKLQDDEFQLPEPEKTQDEKMTASRHLSLTGGAHYLGPAPRQTRNHRSRLRPLPRAGPSGPTREHERSDLPRPLCRLRRRPRRLPSTQRLRHLRAGQAAGLRPRDRLTLHRTPGHRRQAHFLRRPGHPGILALRRNRTVPRHSPSPATASSAANTNRCPSRHSPTAASKATAPSSASICAGTDGQLGWYDPNTGQHIATLESERQARIQVEAKLQELQNQLRQLDGE